MKAFSTYFVDPIKNHYLDFAGKANRKQFWLFVLFNFLVFLVLSIVLNFLGKTGDIVYFVCQLAVLLPSLGIAARRLRDGGFSPWLLLIGLIPVLGWIILLVLYLLPSK
ncbi:MAG: DUF805 domain-containing protein [Elusimicrobiaceae bacterium]|nr:DUF805 domain-containing protein [Elusimicrobiaceae bacterium]